MFGFPTRPRQPLSITGAMLSHVGAVRPHNEDCVSFIVTPQTRRSASSNTVLGVVADGMGGHAAGEVASDIAVQTCLRRFRSGVGKAQTWLRDTIQSADASVRAAAAQTPSRRGMGTTLAILLISDGRLFTGHVGDCRIYALRNDDLKQLTRDHSLVAELVARGDLTETAARHHPQKNIVLQAIGKGENIVPDVSPRGLRLVAGDRYLVCSDGLTDALRDEAITACLRNAANASEACELLCYQALKAGARDNVSIGVFDVHAGSGVPAPSPSSLAETGDISIEGALS